MENVEFDNRMKQYKAEQQKQEKEAEAKRKQEEAERQKREKAEKALQEAQTKTGSRRTTQTREGGKGSGRAKEARCSRSKGEPRGFALVSYDQSLSVLDRSVGDQVRQPCPPPHPQIGECQGRQQSAAAPSASLRQGDRTRSRIPSTGGLRSSTVRVGLPITRRMEP